MRSDGPEVAPLAVTVTGFSDNGTPCQDASIRRLLDQSLLATRNHTCDTVATTIFPSSLWRPDADHHLVYQRYGEIWPEIRRNNPNGTYFQRMIAFGIERGQGFSCGVNQLEHVLTTYHGGNRRRSALQVSIFDPTRDHTHQRQRGFPCLQLVTFRPFGAGYLAVTGIYSTQYLYKKAYGNYLGLCRLGQFVAHGLGLKLARMTCIAAVAVRDAGIRKSDLTELVQSLETQLGVGAMGRQSQQRRLYDERPTDRLRRSRWGWKDDACTRLG
jgi:hypothetical protein